MRKQALDIVESLTGSPEGIASLRKGGQALLTELFKCAAEVSLSRPALTVLVNASQDPFISRDLLQMGAINRAMDYMRDNITVHHDMLLMLLSNVTSTEEGAKKMLQVGVYTHHVVYTTHHVSTPAVMCLHHQHRTPAAPCR